MNDINDFLQNAKSKNLCERGAKIWEHCNSKKQLMDYCLGAWGMEYVATAICEGWGISPESIYRDFAPFNNGKYIRDKDGYTSALYCMPDDVVFINTTSALIVNSDKDVVITRPACELHIVNSNINISGDGNAVVYLYNSKIKNQTAAPVIIKEDRKYGMES